MHELHRRAGAEFVDAGGWTLPVRYGDLRAEYGAARLSAAVADASYLGKLVFTGPDRQDFLQGLLTNDVAGLGAGRSVRTCLLTHKGKLVADFSLYNRGDDLLALAVPAAAPLIPQGLAKYLPLSDTAVKDVSAEGAAFWVGGPSGPGLLERLLGTGGSEGFRAAAWRDRPVSVLSNPPLTDEGLIVACLLEDAAGLWADLLSGGAAAVGWRTVEALRVEAGRPLLGVDAGPENYPAEANLEADISYTKGCYLGQETTTRLKTQGRPPQKLSGLKIEGASPAECLGKSLVQDGQPAGTVTSAVFSPKLNATLALALLKTEKSVPGARFEIAGGSAEVVPLPVQ